MTRFLIVLIFAVGFPAVLMAQGTSLAIGSGAFDGGQPVEVSADALSVDQASGAATFEGNVLVVQGDVRLSAGQVVVLYASDDAGSPSGIARLLASGGVTFVTPTDAVEAVTAEYSIADSTVTLTGDVLLTQGATAISGERLVIDLNSGSGRMEGRVRTIIGGSNN
ncbi:LptA/OstA family protein [Boseongicola aestuarii]|uniref:Lipopolysaccharide export system protein LptA n=1 Tax=Boseongicola aestuarii TaxID=1470561 RepID=A0A238J4S5_9RHOB|nr:LptA/OstA family protein [Boseongicola aestuarii]SMX24904.1 Lipopolysaccharide export system protein LptA precursor [Boseongicola aestuarii]